MKHPTFGDWHFYYKETFLGEIFKAITEAKKYK